MAGFRTFGLGDLDLYIVGKGGPEMAHGMELED